MRASYLITAIFVVHNFLIDEDDSTPVEMRVSDEEDSSPNGDASFPNLEQDEDFEGTKTRDILLRNSYWREYRL